MNKLINFWCLNKWLQNHCLSYWTMWCRLGWLLSRNQVLTQPVFSGSFCLHRSHGRPVFQTARLWDSLDPDQPTPPPTIPNILYLEQWDQHLHSQNLSPFFPIAHMVVILITGHSDFKKSSFSLLNCSAFFCSSSLSKHMGCLLCFQPSWIFNDLQGKDFFLSIFFLQ